MSPRDASEAVCWAARHLLRPPEAIGGAAFYGATLEWGPKDEDDPDSPDGLVLRASWLMDSGFGFAEVRSGITTPPGLDHAEAAAWYLAKIDAARGSDEPEGGAA